MKLINRLLSIVTLTVCAVALFSSCSKDDDAPNGGEPRVRYVRITNPASSDSLLVGAGQGQLIAIVGDNLEEAVDIWFNDRQARLTPTYITSSSILVSVPAQIPNNVTNKLKIIFKNGYELIYEFVVQISEPVVSSMVCEYGKEGETVTIRGDYFYQPLTVSFTGGVNGTLVSVTDQLIEVAVPAGAQPGRITVKTNFGETKSDFFFRDNRNLLIHNDPWSGWWGQNMVVSSTDPLAISGNFTRIKQNIGSWGWTEWIGGREDALATSKNLPAEAVLSPEKYNLKFEINTLKPYNGNRIKIMIGQVNSPDPNWDTEPYFWEAPYDTKGKWQTVVIPFEVVTARYITNWGVRPQGYGVKVWFHGPGAVDADVAFDNLRVVPKVIK